MKSAIALLAIILASLNAFAADAPRKIVLVAGKKSHGPGAHDYERTMRLFKAMLQHSNVADRIVVEEYENGWPSDPGIFDTADTIVFYSDGRDGDKFSDAPFTLETRMDVIDKQIRRGCGFMTMHFSTFVTDKQGEKVLDWTGGFFGWEGEPGVRKWYSRISQAKTLELAAPEHPIARGVSKIVEVNDEVYWKMRFKENDKRITPIWTVPQFANDSGPMTNVVAWALERADGGRGFGTSMGHSFRLWQDENVRRIFMNAIVWTAHVDVPADGVKTEFMNDEQVADAIKKQR